MVIETKVTKLGRIILVATRRPDLRTKKKTKRNIFADAVLLVLLYVRNHKFVFPELPVYTLYFLVSFQINLERKFMENYVVVVFS